MNITEIREKRAKLWKSMEDFLDTRTQANGTLSAEDDASYAKMEADLNALTNEVRRLERKEAIDAEMNRPVDSPLTAKPEKPKDEKPGRASDSYKEDFGRFLRNKMPLHNVLSEGTPADGGYLCPTEFERQIIDGLKEANVMRQLCKVITTDNERKIPIAKTHSVATWTAENQPYTESNPTFDEETIDAFKLTDLCKVSIELLNDSAFDLEKYIADEFANAFASAEEQAFCVGTGSGQPTGLFTANGADVGVTANSETAVTTDEIISLVYSLKAPYRRNAKFLMNDATVGALRKLKDGNGQYLWQPSLQAGEPDRLLGYSLFTSPYVPVMAANAYTIAFGDFSNYWIADRTGRTVQRLNELYSTNGQVGFICTERVDGKIILPEGIKLLEQGH
ncbi:MAG: phage major capsid protein [Clostridia bacterium]|nr:phage major capsid protein [Clostridia bacterium]